MAKFGEVFDAMEASKKETANEMPADVESELREITEEAIAENWRPRPLENGAEQKWPPVPTVESLSYFFAKAAAVGDKYIDEQRYRLLIVTAAYCLEKVPADIAENVIYDLPVSSGRRADPQKWSGTFNQLAAVLRLPPVREHEVRMAMQSMMKHAA